MGITLVEAAKLVQDPIKSAVIELYAQNSDILMVLPFENIPGNAIRYNREEALPGIAFRGVNESYSESSGIMNPLTEALVIAGGDLDVDKFIVQTQGMGVRAAHEAMKVKALAQAYNLKFVKGDSTSDSREFDGLQVRCIGNQLISNKRAASPGGAEVLSLAKLDELIDAVNNPTHLVMGKAMRRLLSAASRNTSVGGFITWDVDAFGRPIAKYGDLPILVLKGNDGQDNVLGFTEASSDGVSSTATSIYCVSFGETLCTGIQNGTMEVRDLGELDTAPKLRTRVEWYTGLACYDGRAAARLQDIKTGAVVA